MDTQTESAQILLQRLQMEIPVTPNPFEELGHQLKMKRAQVLEYLNQWKKEGIIRWMGAIFSTQSFGYKSTLAAFSLPPEKIEQAARIINQHKGVTHNYQRNYIYNLWFTIAVPPNENVDDHIQKLARHTKALKWISLPVIKTYKIRLVLPIAGKKETITYQDIPSTSKIYTPSDEEKSLVRILQKDWPIVRDPYAELAGQWGKEENELLEKIKIWQTAGIIRRIGAILRHRDVGFTTNWMVAWNIEKENEDLIGKKAAQNPFVSHCYLRKTNPDWPYGLFTMLHTRSIEEAQAMVEELCEAIKPLEYKILPTIKEFKKVRLQLFNLCN